MFRAEIAYALLRVTLGVLMLFAGIGKLLGGVGGFAAGLVVRFEETWLPNALVAIAGHLLPFIEVVIGTLLLLGLFTAPALVSAAALMLVLTFGTTVVQDHEAAGRNVLYALTLFILLWVAEKNRISLDRLRAPGRAARR